MTCLSSGGSSSPAPAPPVPLRAKIEDQGNLPELVGNRDIDVARGGLPPSAAAAAAKCRKLWGSAALLHAAAARALEGSARAATAWTRHVLGPRHYQHPAAALCLHLCHATLQVRTWG